MATCPECDVTIDVDEFDVDRGDELSCPECGSNLEVSALAPVELLKPDEDGLQESIGEDDSEFSNGNGAFSGDSPDWEK